MFECTIFGYLILSLTHTQGAFEISPIFCNETLQCISTTILENNIFCDGFYSCSESTITSNNIACDGFYSCSGSSLTATSMLSCDGKSSCHNTTQAVSNGLLKCEGKYSCSYSNHLQSQTTLSCGGFMSCMYANIINTSIIVANGERALSNANIDSENARFYMSQLRGISVNVKGFRSGIGANIYCRKDTQCMLQCDGSGCYELNIYCYYGSECIFLPNECGNVNLLISTNVAPMLDGIQCPNVYASGSYIQDELLDQMSKQKTISRIIDLNKYLFSDELYKYEEQYRYVDIGKTIKTIKNNKQLRYYNNIDGIKAVCLVIIVLFIGIGLYCVITTNKRVME
eukprot:524812_1